jgi:hypothetical protein
MEEWKLVDDTTYSVSNFGGIKNKNKLLSSKSDGKWYAKVKIKGKTYSIHSLVARYFIGERPDNFVIDHIDRNKANNRADNLRYTDVSSNNRNSERCNPALTETDPILRHRERSKLYEKNNKEKVKQKRAEWKEKNKEAQREYFHNRYLQKKLPSNITSCDEIVGYLAPILLGEV